MVRKPPSRSSVAALVGLFVAFVGWTVLTVSWPPMATLDQRLAPPRIGAQSGVGQIASALALLTWPGLIYAAVAALAVRAYRRTLRQLAIGLGLIIVLAWGSGVAIAFALRRPRPASALDVITATGYSYPAGHLVAVVAGTVAVSAWYRVTRRGVGIALLWQLGAALLILIVALDRWLLAAHFVTDLVGGALLGGLAATMALVLAGVTVPVPQDVITELVRGRASPETEAEGKRCAVIYNPTKVLDWMSFRRQIEYELRARGWARPLWLETTEDDPGRQLTRQAVEERVDLVLGAGGDGTIRVICDGLAGSGIPLGLIPAGTGNLLARNIGIPLDGAAALDVAFEGVDKPIDLVRLTVDDKPPDHFAVMAGIGIDAVIMESTRPELKKAVGSAAYFVSAAQNANHPALQATIAVDDAEPFRRKAHLIVVGNVGYLQANIPLIPDAQPDDGVIDLLIASPRRPADWVRLTAQVLARRHRADEQLDRLTGQRMTVTVEHPDSYQMDGDTIGTCTTMTFEVVPGALTLRVPQTVKRALEEAESEEPGQAEQLVLQGAGDKPLRRNAQRRRSAASQSAAPA